MNLKSVLSFVVFSALLTVANGATISSFSPTYGSDGEEIEIIGSGFASPPGTNYVRFGTVLSHHTYVSVVGTRIRAKVPTNAPLGLMTLAVSTGSGFTEFGDYQFRKITAGPYVHSLNPPSGDAGTSVQVHGSHLVGNSQQSAIKVWFNGVQGTITGYGDIMLTCTAPNGVTTGPVTVTRTGWPTNISTAIFYVTPVVTNFSPSFGRAGTNVIVRGRNFTGATAIYFNGLSAPILSNAPNEIHTVVPAGATTGKIRVQTPASSFVASTTNFVVQPLITGFSPNKGNVGTNVTVTGENLVGVTNVLFGGVKITTAATGISYGQFTAKVPNNAPTGPITVQTTNGSFTTSQLFYMPPRIDSFAPSNGAPDSVIRIVGTNFLDATAVSFNGTPAAAFWVTNNGSIGAQVPEGVVSGPIFVTTPHSTTNSSAVFYGAPIVSGFSPDHGLPGTNVTILGTNFAGTTAVSFNGLAAAFTETNGILRAVVPTNATTGPVSVTGPSGTSVSAGVFTLDYASDVAVSVSAPSSVLLGTDFTYVITITNKGPFAAPNVMFTNQLPGAVTFKSATRSQGSILLSGSLTVINLQTINAGSKATVTITVTAGVVDDAINNSSTHSSHPDPVPGNNVAVANTSIYVPPVLGIQRLSDTELRLSWSASLADYLLQSSSDVTSSNSWSNVLTEPEFVGDQKVVTETVGNDSRFYRLKR